MAIGFGLVLLSGLILSPPGMRAGLSPTNAPDHWLSLAEVKQKWADVPLDALQRAAEGGDLTTRHYLGYCYAEGFRFEQNPALGISNYERAAEAGYLPSWVNLGVLYLRGKVVKQDYAKARYYFHMAADRGLPSAQADLGSLYRDGLGVDRNAQEALKWFQHAAAQGDGGAMVEIGRAYRLGDGVPRDLNAAESWFLKAEERGETLGTLNLGLLYDEQGEAEKAISYFRRAADSGQPQAMFSLYTAYWDGRGVGTDHSQAVKWLTKAAETGNAYSECLLGYYYEYPVRENPQDHSVQLAPPNLPEALLWYQRSAEQGWGAGQFHLGLCYLAGKGVEQDEEHGLELIREAADQNNTYAEVELAALYAKGIGIPRSDLDRPTELLKRVVSSDSRDSYSDIKDAYDALISRFEYGVGTERDIFMAVRWYCRGASAGMAGYSIGDKIELGQGKPSLSVAYTGDAGAKSLNIAWPDRFGNEHFLGALSQYLKAVRSEDHLGLIEIGERYVTGEDAPKSATEAWLWFSLAAAKGAPGADSKIRDAEKSMTETELKDAKQLLPGRVKDLDSLTALLRGGSGLQIQRPIETNP
jgi:TPR repeat protein